MKTIVLFCLVTIIFSQEKTITLVDDYLLWKNKYILTYNEKTELLISAQKNRKLIPAAELMEYQEKLDNYLANQRLKGFHKLTEDLLGMPLADSIKIDFQLHELIEFKKNLKPHLDHQIQRTARLIKRLNRHYAFFKLRSRLEKERLIASGDQIELRCNRGQLKINGQDVEIGPYNELLSQIFFEFNNQDNFRSNF
ncbi:MAG: hypothetical protein KDD94_03375 [Calditrichaeota bacterium]|nr:hypothetical protein [Calditrichota bacterium]